MLLVAPIAQLDRASDYRLVNAISPPTSRTTVGRLFDVRDKGRHVILKSRRPLEEWVFEVEVDAGQWKLLSRFFPKWKHPNSARTKFLRTWLGGIYQTAEFIQSNLRPACKFPPCCQCSARGMMRRGGWITTQGMNRWRCTRQLRIGFRSDRSIGDGEREGDGL
jgi:hypothetical protein